MTDDETLTNLRERLGLLAHDEMNIRLEITKLEGMLETSFMSIMGDIVKGIDEGVERKIKLEKYNLDKVLEKQKDLKERIKFIEWKILMKPETVMFH